MTCGSWIVNVQDTWSEINLSLFSLQGEREDNVTFGDNAKRKIIGHGNIGNDASALIENVVLMMI